MTRAGLLCGLAVLALLARAPADEPRESTPPAATFSPKIEELYRAFLRRIGEARRARWAEEMTRQRLQFGQAAGASAEQTAALEKAAAAAMDASLPEWTAKLDTFYRKEIPESEAQAALLHRAE